MDSSAVYSELGKEQPAHHTGTGDSAVPRSALTFSHDMAALSPAVPLAPIVATSSSALSAWCYQSWCLSRKCVLQLRRQPLMSTAALLLPVACILILYIISRAIYSASLPAIVSHDSFSTIVEPCVTQDSYGRQSSASSGCTSISYAPSNAATDSIIQRMLAGTALTANDVVSFNSIFDLQLHWAQHVGTLDVAILFLNDTGTVNSSLLNDYQYRYALWYNSTQGNANWRVLSIQFALEQAIANTVATNVVARYPLRSPSLDFIDSLNTSTLPPRHCHTACFAPHSDFLVLLVSALPVSSHVLLSSVQ